MFSKYYSGDLVPNEAVSGTNGRIATGIHYKIGCNTKNRGETYLEAFPKEEVCRPVGSSSHQDQLWFIESEGIHYKIGCNTLNGGKRYLEAFPKEEVCRPVHGSSHQDQLWSIESEGRLYKFSCNTRNGGKRYLEAFPKEEFVRPVYDSSNQDQLWFIKPTNYNLSAVIKDFQYHSLVKNLDAMATSSVSKVVWTMDNTSYDTNLTAYPNIHESKENESYLSFLDSHERDFFNKLNLEVKARLSGMKSGYQRKTEWTNTDTNIKETKMHYVDTTDVSFNSDITIPPRKRFIFELVWRNVNADAPFSATVKVKGFADRVKTNGSVEKMAQVEGAGVMSLLRYAGYTGKINSTDGKYALASIQGTLKVKGAVSGKLSMRAIGI